MAKKFSELRAKMKPAALEKAAGLSQAMHAAQELRQARALSQATGQDTGNKTSQFRNWNIVRMYIRPCAAN